MPRSVDMRSAVRGHVTGATPLNEDNLDYLYMSLAHENGRRNVVHFFCFILNYIILENNIIVVYYLPLHSV